MLALMLALVLSTPAVACVGKTLMIGATESSQQQVLAQLLAVLIGERTGTTVKVVTYESSQQLHDALLKADLDMYIEYTGVGQVDILHAAPLTDSDALYKAVKEVYNQDLNLVWLKPLGFEAPELVPAGVPAQAAPVVRKDTLKKFPALARLINKLGGKVSNEAMHQLEQEAGTQPANQVARAFLKQNRLI
jgi:osmoprotectant transport system substrate-binding protein